MAPSGNVGVQNNAGNVNAQDGRRWAQVRGQGETRLYNDVAVSMHSAERQIDTFGHPFERVHPSEPCGYPGKKNIRCAIYKTR